MSVIRLPAHSVVVIVGDSLAPFRKMADMLPDSVECRWDTQNPDASLVALHEALRGARLVHISMPGSHPRVKQPVSYAAHRRAIASAARKRGMSCICLRLSGAPEIARDERIDAVHDVTDPADVRFKIVPMSSDRTDLTGPFDAIGDIHGCADELLELLQKLGHADADGRLRRHPEGRVAVLLGDLTDRGPYNRRVLEMARRLTEIGGIVIRGNHDEKLRRWLLGRKVEVKAGLEITIAELADTSPQWREDMAAWIDTLEPHVMLDGGRLAVAHAGIDEEHQGRHTEGSAFFAMYGKPHASGDLNDEGYPIREDWALDYRGAATVVHGHISYDRPRVTGKVVAVDTGCVNGGNLTAYRWPEQDFVSVPAHRAYFAGTIDKA